MSDVVGIQAVRAVLRETPGRARNLYCQRGQRNARVNELIQLARDAGVRHQSVTPDFLERRAEGAAHQGVLLECHELELTAESEFMDTLGDPGQGFLALVLDGVTDPRNFGACLRTANAAGADAVLVPKRKSAPLSPVALKAAQGGAEGLAIVEVTNLARCLKNLKDRGVWVVGTAGESARTYADIEAEVPLVVVLGSEGTGLRRLTADMCDYLVGIPMAGNVDSLNVSVAAGVVLFEVQRKRGMLAAGE